MQDRNARRKTSESDGGAGILVPFREAGHKPPLFFVPAGYGDLRLFRNVVDRLDGDRAVYGLRPPKVERLEGVRKKPVQWLLSTYIDEIRNVRPAGPYCLSGYSSGGLIAVHVAQQLIREGDAVDLLVLLDAPLQNPWWINLPFLGANRLCGLTRLTDTIRWQIIRRWDSLLLRCISDEGLCTHVSILRERQGRAISRPHRLLPAPSLVESGWSAGPASGCPGTRSPGTGLEVHRVPGAHNEMLRGRQGRIFAGVLRSCLKRGQPAACEPRLQHPASWEVKQGAKTLYSASVKPVRLDEVFDWDTMERLHQRGLIRDPVETAESGAFVEAAWRESAESVSRLFAAND